MCFLPAASFIASASIAVIGVMTLRKTTHRREWLFASVPLIFASQQFIEGLLWLVLLKGDMPQAQHWLTQIYGGYAGVVWPAIVPLGIMLIEVNYVRKSFMGLVLLIGLATVISTINILITGGFNVEIMNNSILYDYSNPLNTYATKWSYLIAIGGAFFLSSQPLIRWIGSVNIITFVISYYLYTITYISVCCFFAAVTSGLIYLYFREQKKV